MIWKLAHSLTRLKYSAELAVLLVLCQASLQAAEDLSALADTDDQDIPVAFIKIDANNVVRESLPDAFFGFNIRWSGFQKDLWDKDNDRVKPQIVEALTPFEGALYRYPGGLVANEYMWEKAVLPIGERKRAAAGLAGGDKPPLFGVREFFDFVRQVDGNPLYTLNIIGKGKPSDIQEYASEKMAASNRLLASYIKELTPHRKTRYYQLGNELDRNRYEWSHEKYISRSRATIEAIQSVDADARFIAFLREFRWRYRGEKKGGISTSEDFIRDVLTGLPMVNDYSLHFYYDGVLRPGGKFKHIQDVVDRIKGTLAVAASVRGKQPLNVWITEHSRRLIVTKDNEQMAKTYTTNLQAALSTADFLTAMTQIPEVKSTGLQALNGVGRQIFDASVRHGDLRPLSVYWAMRILNQGRQGRVLSTTTQSPAGSGYPGGYDVRATGLASEANGLTVWVVNRALTSMDSDISYLPLKGQTVEMQHYFLAGKHGINADALGDDYQLDIQPAWQEAEFSDSGVLSVRLPPSSVSTIVLRGKGGAK